MQLTAREWIELIADPEIREKALANIDNPAITGIYLNEKLTSVNYAISYAFRWENSKEGHEYWDNLYNTPPALLPFPNKEREQAEALLMEFANWTFCQPEGNYTVKDMAADFLNQKYPS